MTSPVAKLSHLAATKTAGIWMGILNITPDSFSDGGDHWTYASALRRAHEMAAAGAQILDVGGVSTRPGSEPVSAEEELQRVLPICKELRRSLPSDMLLSIDTFSPQVAASLARQGLVDLINDIAAGTVVEEVDGLPLTTLDIAAKYELGVVLMHMQGKPKTMQKSPTYTNCIEEVATFLQERALAAKAKGIQFIALDPGVGFGKTVAHNQELLSSEGIARISALGFPVLVGLSRKRFLSQIFGNVPGIQEPKNRDFQTKLLEQQCLQAGARMIRSHRMPSEVATEEAYKQEAARTSGEFPSRPHYRQEPEGWQVCDTSAAYLTRLMQRARELGAERPLGVVFDLDGTLFDVNSRSLGIVKEWLSTPATSLFSPQIIDLINTMDIEHIGYSIRHAFENMGLNLENPEIRAIYNSIERTWQERFFDGETLIQYDTPHKGAVKFVKMLHESGFRIFYLSGRYRRVMEGGTRKQLEKFGFPLDNCELVLKEDLTIDDFVFKPAAFAEIVNSYTVIANFENEYANIGPMMRIFPESVHVIVDAPHSAKVAPPPTAPVFRISDFII